MSKTKSQLRYGLWPDSPAPAHQPAELTVAAQRMAMSALAELNRLGVTVTLDETGRARFRAAGIASRDARLTIERQGDFIEAYLVELAIAAASPAAPSSVLTAA